jgi:hypothetical protein
MFDWKIALYAATIMFFLEYFVLLRLYKRDASLQSISLIVAPAMIIIALYISYVLQTYTTFFIKDRLDPLAVFISFALLELPLSIKGYRIIPDASIIERIVVATSFGVVSVLVAQKIVNV